MMILEHAHITFASVSAIQAELLRIQRDATFRSPCQTDSRNASRSVLFRGSNFSFRIVTAFLRPRIR